MNIHFDYIRFDLFQCVHIRNENKNVYRECFNSHHPRPSQTKKTYRKVAKLTQTQQTVKALPTGRASCKARGAGIGPLKDG